MCPALVPTMFATASNDRISGNAELQVNYAKGRPSFASPLFVSLFLALVIMILGKQSHPALQLCPHSEGRLGNTAGLLCISKRWAYPSPHMFLILPYIRGWQHFQLEWPPHKQPRLQISGRRQPQHTGGLTSLPCEHSLANKPAFTLIPNTGWARMH